MIFPWEYTQFYDLCHKIFLNFPARNNNDKVIEKLWIYLNEISICFLLIFKIFDCLNNHWIISMTARLTQFKDEKRKYFLQNNHWILFFLTSCPFEYVGIWSLFYYLQIIMTSQKNLGIISCYFFYSLELKEVLLLEWLPLKGRSVYPSV